MSYHLEVAYHNDQAVTELRTRDDVDRFVDELLAAGPDHTAATAYAIDPDEGREFPNHELTIGASAQTGLGAVRYSGEEGAYYLKGAQANPDGVTFAYFGTAHEFPADAEVPLSLVRQALWGLLTSCGERPSGLSWTETD
ncbi:immunity protein Imm1 of predicted polymorphic toxin system [Saccharothrix carnea]|uniref:Immunity protein Imm1 of predicted polymorphic toxin system n=1 Tax=Saccharothrix carnea TaxID=1280637 RepID=A0A2P8I9Q0_SACCR|nr:Imm1 family immunity protein [Saccharothrix carnea]PSL55184.1 immunity protein Imm1 of predicted polymorphic toxin system [Saccharothrix carnea]